MGIRVINYNHKYHSVFKELNLEWLDKYNLTESHDLEVLEDPKKFIMDKGGCLFLAMLGDKVVGSAGLMKESDSEYELVKMSVDPQFRGQGIGKQLLEHCLGEARKLKAKKIFLFSNSQLQTALKLYKKYGFQHVVVIDAPFLTADVKMELHLTPPAS